MNRGPSILMWNELKLLSLSQCLLSELNSHKNFNFGECWTISCQTSWVRVERLHQTHFNKSSLTAPQSSAEADVSSRSQKEDNLSDHQAAVLTHTSGHGAPAGHGSRAKIPSVTFPSDTCPSERLFNNMEGNQVGQGHNFLCSCQETQRRSC